MGIVSRLTRQKGTDILAKVAGQIVAEGIYMAALGTGDPEYEEFFRNMADRFPGRSRAHRLRQRSGPPDRSRRGHVPDAQPLRTLRPEPDVQLAVRYRSVVRATGGLDDTIDEGTGFKFREYSGRRSLEAVREAIAGL